MPHPPSRRVTGLDPVDRSFVFDQFGWREVPTHLVEIKQIQAVQAAMAAGDDRNMPAARTAIALGATGSSSRPMSASGWTKACHALKGMGLGHIEKVPDAIAELAPDSAS